MHQLQMILRLKWLRKATLPPTQVLIEKVVKLGALKALGKVPLVAVRETLPSEQNYIR